MPSVTGRVNEALEARVALHLTDKLGGELEVECIVDTGFDGALVLPGEIIERLGLAVISHEIIFMVGDLQDSADVALAKVRWLGEVRSVDVILKDDYLLGTALLDGARLTIDYARHTVIIDK